ncbi:hypothetical protein PhCBS80983_g04028 [Powellomyces hirtus]|uniref:Probable metalloprotease ARX1 n=1 Tax=Powellomyces hirtus TaxID=109895 RepID=A0A507DZ86_9FUNG|nr:hypothetical protein PhCBS80983_g04028 [Powellomyces hirtus]
MSLMEISQPTVDRLDQDNNLSDPSVVTKYTTGADIANAVIKQLLPLVVVGARIIDVCSQGDAMILAETSKVHKKGERGIARPTCLCVNNLVRNSTPVDDNEAVTLKDGDLVKIDLGVHIDGYISALAHTTIVTSNPSSPISGPQADVVCAAHYASIAALNLLTPGVSSEEITQAVTGIAAHFNCTPVHSTFSRQVKRFLLNGGNSIANSTEPEHADAAAAESYTPFEVEAGDAYVLDIVLSTGSGQVKDIHQQRPNVITRDVNRFYNLKHQSSRKTLSAVASTFSVFPFPTRSLLALDRTHRIGVQECLAHSLLVPEWMQIEQSGQYVARFAMTVLVRPTSAGGPLRITAADLQLPYVHSEIDIGTSQYADTISGKKTRSTKSKKAIAAPASSMDLS